MPALRVLAALAVLASSSSRAGGPEPYRCSLHGGPEWHAYTSKHFVLYTDVRRSTAEGLVERFERMHVLVVKALVGEDVDIPGRVRVVALRDPRDLEALTGRDYVEAFFTTSGLHEPTIVLAVERLQADAEAIAHEIVHHVSQHLFPRQPMWFGEGLATFVQTVGNQDVAHDAPTGTHVVRGARSPKGGAAGLASARILDLLRSAGHVSAAELLAWRRSGDDALGSYHARAWLLYHYLWNTRSKALADYTGRLSNGDDPAASWRAAFPDLDPATPAAMASLDGELDPYRKAGRYVYYAVSADPEVSFAERPVAPADVHALVIQVRWDGAGVKERNGADLEEALREDPAQPIAAWRSASDDASRTKLMRAAVAAHGDDWRAWQLLGDALVATGDRGGAEEAYRKAVALGPDSSSPYNSLAWLLVQVGRPREALAPANRAVDLAPGSPYAVDTLAAVAAKLGKCAEAVVLQRRALEWFRGSSSAAEGYRKRLAEYEQRCATPAAAKP